MTAYDPDRIQKLFESVIRLPVAQRASWLEGTCAGEPELRKIVEALVAEDQEGQTVAGTVAGDSSGATLSRAASDWMRLAGSKADAAEHPAEEQPTLLTTGGEKGERPISVGAVTANSQFGPYRLLRELGRGGMGTVYLAERADGQYQQQVAIKVMSARFADGPIAWRFFQERQILASLDHPNIARLLDGGTTDDGLPFLVMEYIGGVPIDRYLAEKKPRLTALLGVFRKICSAVAYAHRNLIVHRDLKPANILVTPDGEPKLLDFGIAKPLDESSTLTAPENAAMTPQYASPEQIQGFPITTTSDIYSLGVVLYEMLTGRRPYRQTSGALDLAKAILTENPRTLNSNSNRRFDEDLENIVQMALRKEPARRYATAEQFAEDIRRYQEGYPVVARADTRAYRVRKFVGRHRYGVIAAGLALTALVGGSIAIWREARIAERRFNDVRQLAHAVMFDYTDAVQPLPGSTPVRQRMVKDALEYLDKLSREADDPGLRRELVDAYVRIGNIQGNSYQSNLGDTPGAMASAKKALAAADLLLKQNHAADSLNAAASAHDLLGTLLYQQGDLGGANREYRQSLSLEERAKEQNPGDFPTVLALSQTLQHLGDLHGGVGVSNLGKTQDAVAFYRRAANLDRDVLRGSPASQARRKELYSALLGLGTIELSMGEEQTAEAHFAEALGIIEALFKEEPNNANYRVEIAGTSLRIGHQFTARGNPAGALPYLERASRTMQPLADSDPRNTLYRRNLSVIESHFVVALRALNKSKEALPHARKSLELALNLLAVNPQSAEAKSDVAISRRRMGEVFFELGDTRNALREASESVASLQKLSAGGDAYMSNYLALSLAALGTIEGRSDPAAAIDTYRKAEALQSRLITADPSNVVLRSDLAKSEIRLGVLYNRVGSAAEAQTVCRSAIATWDQLKQHGPLKSDDAAALAHCQAALRRP